jgi:hypothetical protein
VTRDEWALTAFLGAMVIAVLLGLAGQVLIDRAGRSSSGHWILAAAALMAVGVAVAVALAPAKS